MIPIINQIYDKRAMRKWVRKERRETTTSFASSHILTCVGDGDDGDEVWADKKGNPPNTDRGQKSQGGSRHDADHKGGSSTERPESHQTEKSDEEGK